MASITRSRVNELTDKEIASVQLSNRRQYGEYTAWDALSSDGSKTYTVTVDAAGKACGCTCPSCVPCKHRAAAEFEFVWSAPVAKPAQVWDDSDTLAHIEDSMGELQAIAEEILRDEKIRKEVAALPDADGDAMDELDRAQEEKRRKMAANQAYRDAYPGDYGYCDAA